MSETLTTRRDLLVSSAPAVLRSNTIKRPNFLFILADDHAGHVLGAAGNRLASTPNLDRLASEGTRFANHYCNAPVCTPSRQSLLTGQLPHMAGVTRLPTALDPSKPTLAKQFLAAGYHTGVFGKMHFQRPPQPGLHGFQTMMLEGELAKEWRRTVSQSAVPGAIAVQPEWRPFRDPASVWLNARKLPLARKASEMKAAFLVDKVISFLEDYRDEPFALWASFHEPHSPFDFPIELRDRYRLAQFQAPDVNPEERAQIPLVFRDLNPGEVTGIRAAYFTSVAYLDQNIGRILQAVKGLGLDRETLVVYASDHGYMLGEHGRFEKHCGYEPALRVPCILRWPDRIRRGTVTDLTEHVDIAPTVLDLLGLPPLPLEHGHSLKPYLTGRGQIKRRTSVFAEYLENEEAYLRTDQYKFIFCSGKRRRTDGYETDQPQPGRYTMLFDLQQDPEERSNVAPQRPEIASAMGRAMLQRFRATHPDAEIEPGSLSPEAALEFYLRPRDAGVPYQLPGGRDR